MGAAAVRFPSRAENKYEVQSSSFTGPISSISAELRGLTLAQTLILPVDDTTILTDSLASLHALRRRHRTDFQYYEEQDSIQPHLDQLVHQGPAGLAVKPLDLHVVHVGSIPAGPTHGEV